MPKLMQKPTRATPPKTPHARASPLGFTRVDSEKRPPLRKGPAARPAADRVWARPLSLPRTLWFGAELVICSYQLRLDASSPGRPTSSNALVRPPTVDTDLINSAPPSSTHSQTLPLLTTPGCSSL